MSNIILKTEEEIVLIKKACDILSKMLGVIVHNTCPGVSLLTLDKIAEEYILDNGGVPACKGYNGFPSTLCLSVNEKVVHGIPNKYVLKNGDIISIDSCVAYNGYCSDATYTVGVGEIDDNIKKMLQVTKDSLYAGIEQCKAGNHLGDIGYAIENKITENGFYVVKKYCGHGIGKKMHEEPQVVNYGHKGSGILIKDGMVLAIEPIVGETTGETKTLDNGWDVVMVNGCMSAHFEHTIAVYNKKPNILTTFKYCE